MICSYFRLSCHRAHFPFSPVWYSWSTNISSSQLVIEMVNLRILIIRVLHHHGMLRDRLCTNPGIRLELPVKEVGVGEYIDGAWSVLGWLWCLTYTKYCTCIVVINKTWFLSILKPLGLFRATWNATEIPSGLHCLVSSNTLFEAAVNNLTAWIAWLKALHSIMHTHLTGFPSCNHVCRHPQSWQNALVEFFFSMTIKCLYAWLYWAHGTVSLKLCQLQIEILNDLSLWRNSSFLAVEPSPRSHLSHLLPSRLLENWVSWTHWTLCRENIDTQ